MNARGGNRVHSPEQPVGAAGSPGFVLLETCPQVFIPPRPWSEAVDQRAEVEAGTASDHRQTPAGGDVAKNGSSDTCEVTGGKGLSGVSNIDPDGAEFRGGHLPPVWRFRC